MAARIHGPFADLKDSASLRRNIEFAFQLGHQGRIAVYLPQIAAVKEEFGTPGEELIVRASAFFPNWKMQRRMGLAPSW